MKQLKVIILMATLLMALSYPHKTVHPVQDRLVTYPMMASVIDILGYDPHITFYPANKTAANNDHVTIYVHGWGESQNSIAFLQANTHLLPGNIIGFNFKSALVHSAKKTDLLNANFCQTDDIAALLTILKVLDNCQLPIFHLFGVTQGAGTIITTIARLTQYQRYKKFFEKIQISHEQAQRILTKIQAGTIVLDCPLLDLNLSLKHKLTPYHAGWLSPLITYGLACITKYNPSKDRPLKAARHLKAVNIPTLVHFQKNNLMVGNNGEAEFYQKLYNSHSYLVLGDDGGYAHRGETLAPALHAFRKKYNGPHYSDVSALQHGEVLMKQSPPESTDIARHIEHVYEHSNYTFIPQSHSQWEQQFAQYDTTTFIQKLGYDPVVHLYHGDARVQNDGVTVYVHGYGDNYKFTVPFFMLNTHLLPGTIVSFNFQDVTENAFKLKVGKSSVGQAGDIATLSLVLKMLDECGLETIHLFGYSRGGATTVTTLARLCTYHQHALFFEQLGIDEQQAQRIIAKVQRGTIVLNCPLVDSKAVAHYWFGPFDGLVMNTIIPHIMEHRADADQAIDAARVIQPMNFAILVHFQKDDKILGNNPAVDGTFYNNLKGLHTYLVIANEGGHMHAGRTLGTAIQAFKEKYNAPHYATKELLDQGHILIAQAPQTDAAVTEYVTKMYR